MLVHLSSLFSASSISNIDATMVIELFWLILTDSYPIIVWILLAR